MRKPFFSQEMAGIFFFFHSPFETDGFRLHIRVYFVEKKF